MKILTIGERIALLLLLKVEAKRFLFFDERKIGVRLKFFKVTAYYYLRLTLILFLLLLLRYSWIESCIKYHREHR